MVTGARADQGIGTAGEDGDRLSTPFYRVQRPEDGGTQGSRLGLYIMKGLAWLVQSEIWLGRRPGFNYTVLPTLVLLPRRPGPFGIPPH